MDVDLLNEVAACSQDVLQLLGGNVLSLGQLEDVLLAVDDGEASTVVNESNVASSEPALRVDCLPGVLLVLEVALEDSVSTDADLSAREGLIGRAVVHLGHIHQLDLASSSWVSNVSRNELTKNDD